MLENTNNFNGGRLAPAAVGFEHALTFASFSTDINRRLAGTLALHELFNCL